MVGAFCARSFRRSQMGVSWSVNMGWERSAKVKILSWLSAVVVGAEPLRPIGRVYSTRTSLAVNIWQPGVGSGPQFENCSCSDA